MGTAGPCRLDAMAAAPEHPGRQEMPAGHTRWPGWVQPDVTVPGRRVGRAGQDLPAPADVIAAPDDPEARDRPTRASAGGVIRGTARQPARRTRRRQWQWRDPAGDSSGRAPCRRRWRHALGCRQRTWSTKVLPTLMASSTGSGTRPSRSWGRGDAPRGRPGRGGLRHVARPGRWGPPRRHWPSGSTAPRGAPAYSPKHGMREVRLARPDCPPCVHPWRCTRRSKRPVTWRHVSPMKPGQSRGTTADQPVSDPGRPCGVESPHEPALRRAGLRRCRSSSPAHTHWPHLITATAIHRVRVAAGLAGSPRAQTRPSPLAALAA